MKVPTWTISAIRSDGCKCEGTVCCKTHAEALRDCKRTFRAFTAHGPIGCVEHSKFCCYQHVGQKFTFSEHTAVADGRYFESEVA